MASEILQFHCPIATFGSRIAWAAGKTLVVYNLETESFESKLDNSNHSDTIRAISFNMDGPEIATAGEDKRVVITSGRKFLHGKKIMALHFDENGTVLFGDKFGDFYRLHECVDGEASAVQNGDDSDDEIANKGLELLFGHISAISTSLFSAKRKLLVSADRDEKIRVGRYPRADIIESFLLKHRRYVSHLAWGNEEETMLVSAGADGNIIEWDLADPCLPRLVKTHAVGQDEVGFHSITSDGAGRIFFVSVDNARKIGVIDSEVTEEWAMPFEIQAIKSYRFGAKSVLIAIDSNSHLHLIDSSTGVVTDSVCLPSDVPGVPISYLKLVHHENLQVDERDSKRKK